MSKAGYYISLKTTLASAIFCVVYEHNTVLGLLMNLDIVNSHTNWLSPQLEALVLWI